MRSWMRRVMQAVRAALLLPRAPQAMQEQEARALLEALRQARPGGQVLVPASLAQDQWWLVARLCQQVQQERQAQE